MKITIRNDFHKTETKAIVRNGYMTLAHAKRVGKRLCSHLGCACSGVLGARGPQEFHWVQQPSGGYEFFPKDHPGLRSA